MEKIYLNNNRQEELIDQMYGLNRQITNVEGALLRLAENSGIKRKDFINSWVGNEINHNWAVRPGKTKLWLNFAENNKRITSIKSSNDSELISSIFAFSPETDLKENKINISSALEENISIFLVLVVCAIPLSSITISIGRFKIDMRFNVSNIVPSPNAPSPINKQIILFNFSFLLASARPAAMGAFQPKIPFE